MPLLARIILIRTDRMSGVFEWRLLGLRNFLEPIVARLCLWLRKVVDHLLVENVWRLRLIVVKRARQAMLSV